MAGFLFGGGLKQALKSKKILLKNTCENTR
jgi:hypothetical protein